MLATLLQLKIVFMSIFLLLITGYIMMFLMMNMKHGCYNCSDLRPRNEFHNMSHRGTQSRLHTTNNYKQQPDMLQILLWTPFWDRENYFVEMGQSAFIKHNCPIAMCVLTRNRTLLSSSNAVLVHINNVKSITELPPFHLPDQPWIYFNLEPPKETRPSLKQFNGFFNLSLSYRLDSDIVNVAGITFALTEAEKKEQKAKMPNNYAAGKSKLVVWMSSHCKTKSRREQYVSELQKFIPVDIYGACGDLDCSKRRACPKMLAKMYKFYLAFENDICLDYISEKAWLAIVQGAVPVVYGGADYSRQLPPQSYIDVRDFQSPQSLAEYLKRLDQNDTEYNAYFEWKNTHYARVSHLGDAFCDLCSYLHNPQYKGTSTIIHHLHRWHGSATSCTHPKVYFKSKSWHPS